MLVVGSWNHHHSHLNLRDVKTYKIERHQMSGSIVSSHFYRILKKIGKTVAELK